MPKNQGKSASLVIYKSEGGVKCIYEIEGSNQKFFPQHPNYKVPVTIYPVTDADIKRNLEKIQAIVKRKLTKKGYLFILEGLNNPAFDEVTIKSKLFELLITDKEHHLTQFGITYLRKNMTEHLTTIADGNLAIDECSDKKGEAKLVKFML